MIINAWIITRLTIHHNAKLLKASAVRIRSHNDTTEITTINSRG